MIISLQIGGYCVSWLAQAWAVQGREDLLDYLY